MDINLNYDSSVSGAPPGFKIAMAAAAQYLDRLFTNPITVNINVGYGEYNGAPLSGTTSEGGVSGIGLTYAQLTSALLAHGTSAADLSAYGSLPASDPTNGGWFLVPGAEQKALGLLPANGTGNDGSVGFGDGSAYDYATNGTVAPGQLDFMGVAEHELTHALGRIVGLQFQPGWWSPLDLFRFSAPGTLELTDNQPAYFSTDNGHTNLNNFSTVDDTGDWAASAGNDAFGAISQTGVINTMSAADVTEMNVLGFTVACFAAGTGIATPSGAVAVDALRVGDTVLTAAGAAVPVVWLGHRRVACARHPRPHDVWPIRVQPHAFGRGRPARMLWLSPDHAVFWRGALIPVRYLQNGASIAQVQCDSIEYWHVELARHDILLAEGLPAESFLDTGNRAAFVAGAAALQLHPDFARRVWRDDACAPLLLTGPRVAAARRHLLARALRLGHRLSDDPALALRADGRAVAVQRDGEDWHAALPAGTVAATLLSRQWMPAHIDPASDDTRRLGVALRALWLDGRPVDLASAGLSAGWHQAEPELRWSDGAATLSVAGVRRLQFRLAMTGRYWVSGPGRAADSARTV